MCPEEGEEGPLTNRNVLLPQEERANRLNRKKKAVGGRVTPPVPPASVADDQTSTQVFDATTVAAAAIQANSVTSQEQQSEPTANPPLTGNKRKRSERNSPPLPDIQSPNDLAQTQVSFTLAQPIPSEARLHRDEGEVQPARQFTAAAPAVSTAVAKPQAQRGVSSLQVHNDTAQPVRSLASTEIESSISISMSTDPAALVPRQPLPLQPQSKQQLAPNNTTQNQQTQLTHPPMLSSFHNYQHRQPPLSQQIQHPAPQSQQSQQNAQIPVKPVVDSTNDLTIDGAQKIINEHFTEFELKKTSANHAIVVNKSDNKPILDIKTNKELGSTTITALSTPPLDRELLAMVQLAANEKSPKFKINEDCDPAIKQKFKEIVEREFKDLGGKMEGNEITFSAYNKPRTNRPG